MNYDSHTKKSIKTLLLIIIFLIGVVFRFYNLNWGSPYYFHPDERQNIAYPVLTSSSIFMLDQQNFDTGTFPLIVIKIIYSFITNIAHNTQDRVEIIITISRVISAVISTAIILLLYFIVKKIFNSQKAYLTLILSVFSVGFIQFSHFGTIELWEALFFLLLFYYGCKIAKLPSKKACIICGIILGFSISTKILSIMLTPGIILSFTLYLYSNNLFRKNYIREIKKIFPAFFIFIISLIFSFTITSLPLIKNIDSSLGSIRFESNVATGKLPVFYTQSFTNTTAVVFQFIKIYPFLLNPLITIIFIPSLIWVIILGIKNKKFAYLLLALNYLLVFLPLSFIFAKWTRYMLPTLPYMYIITAVAIDDLFGYIAQKKNKILSNLIVAITIITSFIFAMSFFITVYLNHQSPVIAGEFAEKIIQKNSKIITEPYDLGISPFNNLSTNIIYFNFYDLDNPSNRLDESMHLENLLSSADYIILPSQRLLVSRLNNKKIFPKGYNFYSNLLNGNLGFEKIYETPCDLFCRITYLNNPVFSFEETASVFDRPTVYIFKRKYL